MYGFLTKNVNKKIYKRKFKKIGRNLSIRQENRKGNTKDRNGVQVGLSSN